ncbi:aminotransferase class V-fold PLP-dependent enzyme [Sediminibacillus dalangtanensis]|uniref:Aminotransferase class V-fold PLP-dependent enzyme n=1 Tax=Sediminibacillus dalangtanensis TaxID=2729421 RepID=A0ABX7VVN5_9BACI|nr:cysteine desulfurase family protein [Sediminibacillus dalangtanensis]QTN00090.1 aminotransferase class V-fold PLP-dependent enzyme [Sediminibacillus dalangtanensis]
MIYLDNSATTKPYQEVIDSFTQVSEKYYGNPSSIHRTGAEAEKLLLRARQQAAELLHVKEEEIVFTSGGTEGNNTAIKGIALAHQNRGRHIITSQVEHPSVLEACRGLEELGFSITYLPVNNQGLIDPAAVEAAITEETILISIMHVNNELGTIQPIEEIGKIAKQYPKLHFHVDHVQGFGKVPLSLPNSGIDLCTISGHKIHGLKGTGLLFSKKGTHLFPLMHGGGQEQSIRSGTENLAGTVSLVKAVRLILEEQKKQKKHLLEMKERLWTCLDKMKQVSINSPAGHAPHIINLSVPGYKPEVLIHALSEKGYYISTKSACSSKNQDVSSVLAACGKPEAISSSALRISLSYHTQQQEIEGFCKALDETLHQFSEVMG